MEERLKLLQSLQKFLKDLESLLEWFQWARDASIPEARADFSLTSLMEQLQELNVSIWLYITVTGGISSAL